MKKLYIAILYHQHQPMYKDLVENYYYFPWVRLHAIKDYYDMLVWVEKYPTLKLNFNFVPSLLLQLEDYANNAMDKHLELTIKPCENLTYEDKIYILKNFFNCNWETMLYPYKRYKELFELRGSKVLDEELYRKCKYYNKQDWLDLQIWSNLVWFDPYWRKTDNDIKNLFAKEKNFTEEDKKVIVKKQRWICGQILAKLKELQDANKIEISFSAFYHPILPLLCNPAKAKISNPNIVLPKNTCLLKEDAEKQILLGKHYYEKKFGCPPAGFWPSEGSVSEDVILLLHNYGIKWCATDEEILKNTIFLETKKYPPRDVIYKHYQVKIGDASPVYVIFRDREISDNIGFVYFRWNYVDAVKDIENKLKLIYENVYAKNNSNNVALVSIILDGENCWEYYKNDGEDFLNEFYNMLTSSKLWETVRVSDFINSFPTTEQLKTIWPGSWINANYNIWIGHPEDNTAWEYLYKTRNFLTNYITHHPEVDENIVKSCWEEIYIAEGSDWYWWFGDEHFTPQSDVFDFLFRKHLKNVYVLLNQSPPDYLDIPIKMSFKTVEYQMPSDFISPVIDGKISNYFEWSSAGRVVPIFSSMHQTKNIISALYFGFDLENLYIRLDYNKNNIENLQVCMYIKTSEAETDMYCVKFYLKYDDENYTVFQQNNVVYIGKSIKIDKIVEFSLPFSLLKTSPGQPIKFFTTLVRTEQEKSYELERIPHDGFIEIVHPDKSYTKQFWTV